MVMFLFKTFQGFPALNQLHILYLVFLTLSYAFDLTLIMRYLLLNLVKPGPSVFVAIDCPG